MHIFMNNIMRLNVASLLWRISNRTCLNYPMRACFNKEVAHSCALSSCAKLRNTEKAPTDDGLLKKVGAKLKLWFRDEPKAQLSCMSILEGCVDNVDVARFINEFQLPDTLQSWFVVTVLHVWMCMTRAMREGDMGKYMCQQIAKFMVKDLQMRISKLGVVTGRQKRNALELFNQQFQTAICAYDEGLLYNDKVLAAALWKSFFDYDCKDPHHLEILVHYVRKNLSDLDELDSAEFIYNAKVNWTPLEFFLTSPQTTA